VPSIQPASTGNGIIWVKMKTGQEGEILPQELESYRRLLGH